MRLGRGAGEFGVALAGVDVAEIKKSAGVENGQEDAVSWADVADVEVAAPFALAVEAGRHLALRRDKSRRAMEELHAWLEAEQPKHLPKGPLGEAIGYALSQWKPLTRFLDDARLPVDNNASERALRPAALGRKNYLFVGNDQAGQNIAGLYSLVATCEANGVNPFEYLADVLPRLASHPASRTDELLPHRWRPRTVDSS